MKKPVMILILIAAVTYLPVLAGEKKGDGGSPNTYFYVTHGGYVGIRWCADKAAYDSFVRDLQGLYKDLHFLYEETDPRAKKKKKDDKESGFPDDMMRGVSISKYVVEPIGNFDEKEAKSDAFVREQVDKLSIRFRKEIQQIRRETQQRVERILATKLEPNFQVPAVENIPPVPKVKSSAMFWTENVLCSYPGPKVIRFWGRADTAPGWDPDRKVRVLLEFGGALQAQQSKMTEEFLDEWGKAVGTKWSFNRDKPTLPAKASHMQGVVVEMIPDGAWRQYTIPLRFEIYRKYWIGIPKATLRFSAIDPAMYYFDDVMIDGDIAKMPLFDIERMLAAQESRRRDGKRPVEYAPVPKKDRNNPDPPFEKPVVPVARLENSSFDRPLGDFSVNWKRSEKDDATIPVVRVQGDFDKGIVEQKKRPARPAPKDPKEDREEPPPNSYLKCDATQLK